MFGLSTKSNIGIEIQRTGIGAVLVRQTREQLLLERAVRCSLPEGVVQSTLREPQVLQPERFVKALREAWGGLHLKQCRVAVSLPDSVGLFLLETLETPWKKKSEALAMLRWKLAKRLGFDPDALHLDARLLRHDDTGVDRFLVVLALLPVVRQYEELFLETGLQPAQISLHRLSLLGLYGRYPVDEGRVIIRYDDQLSVVVLSEGMPVFNRTRTLSRDSGSSFDSLRRELIGSLAACRQIAPTAGRFYCCCEPEDQQFLALVSEIAGETPFLLQPSSVVTAAEGALPDAALFESLSAATGVAAGGY